MESRKLERMALRHAVIAGATDCLMNAGEAAAFMGISESTLRDSDIPRVSFHGPRYLKSECLKYMIARLSHTVELKSA